MKKTLLLLTCLILSVSNIQAQSWKNLFSKKNVSKVASAAGIDIPFEIEGEWVFQGTAVELETDNMLKKAAAEMAAIAIEEKINQQQEKYGIKPGMVKFTFNKDGVVNVSALNHSIPARYELSKDKKTMHVTVANMINMDATIKHTLDNSLSILFNADKIVELIKYFSTQVDYASLQAITQILDNYDGLKVGVELQKVG